MGSLQTTVQNVLDQLRAHAPHLGLAGGGILLVLIAIKAGKGLMRLALIVVGLGALVAAAFWFLHQ